MTAYVFPGQGSQSRGMGELLFPLFPDLIEKANKILGYSIITLCLDNHDEKLNQTQYTQPALYVVNALTYLKKIQKAHQEPDYVAGHSLGEYNALLAANVFDFETGLELVKKRGQLMSEATNGCMAAIVGLKNNHVQTILEQEHLTDISIANDNSFTQVVISGPQNAIAISQPLFEKAGATLFKPLKVSGAFHSRYMQNAKQSFRDFLKSFTFSAPTIPVIANVNARAYQYHEICYHLTQQITSPVQWTSIVRYLLEKGEKDFSEIGPGTVLTGMIRRIQNGN